MKRHISVILVIGFIICFTPGSTLAQTAESSWYLPIQLSDKNTEVKFHVDSTWHMVEGTASGMVGNIQLANERDPSTVQVLVNLPVGKFNTGNSMRDNRLREVMDLENHPMVTFKGNGLNEKCTPAHVVENGNCDDTLSGEIIIRGVTKKANVPVQIVSGEHQAFWVTGQLPLSWKEFGVEDPSIFIARVDPVVKVYFRVHVRGDQLSKND